MVALSYMIPETRGGRRYGATLGESGSNFDLSKKAFRSSIWGPSRAIAHLFQSPAALDYLNPEGIASGIGTETILAGRNAAQADAANQGAIAGLGSGFSSALAASSNQAASSDAARALMMAEMMGQDRRFQADQTQAEAVMGGQTAAIQRRQARRGQKQGLGGMAGGLGGAGIGALIGSIVPGVGTLLGAGIGGMMGGSTGAAVDQFNGRFSPQINFSPLMMAPFLMQAMQGGGATPPPAEAVPGGPQAVGQSGMPGAGIMGLMMPGLMGMMGNQAAQQRVSATEY